MRKHILRFLIITITLFTVFIFYQIEADERSITLSLDIVKKTPALIRWIFSEKLYQPEGLDWIYPCVQSVLIFTIILGILNIFLSVLIESKKKKES